MNDKEKYEMIAMCALALRDGKKLQIKTMLQGYQDTTLSVDYIVGDILNGVEYRIKPEPKVTVRLAWLRGAGNVPYPVVVHSTDSDAVKTWNDFIDWADEAKEYEVPE
jgi:hypothetical protein